MGRDGLAPGAGRPCARLILRRFFAGSLVGILVFRFFQSQIIAGGPCQHGERIIGGPLIFKNFMQQAGGIYAGLEKVRPKVQPTPLTEPKRVARALNPEAEDVIERETGSAD